MGTKKRPRTCDINLIIWLYISTLIHFVHWNCTSKRWTWWERMSIARDPFWEGTWQLVQIILAGAHIFPMVQQTCLKLMSDDHFGQWTRTDKMKTIPKYGETRHLLAVYSLKSLRSLFQAITDQTKTTYVELPTSNSCFNPPYLNFRNSQHIPTSYSLTIAAAIQAAQCSEGIALGNMSRNAVPMAIERLLHRHWWPRVARVTCSVYCSLRGNPWDGLIALVGCTWWLIPLSKWVITPIISGLTLLIPFITGVITHLLSGMSHHVCPKPETTTCFRLQSIQKFWHMTLLTWGCGAQRMT